MRRRRGRYSATARVRATLARSPSLAANLAHFSASIDPIRCAVLHACAWVPEKLRSAPNRYQGPDINSSDPGRASRTLLLVVVALIGYASLYPFELQWSRLAAWLDAPSLRLFMATPSDASDTIANLLFYLPLGFVLLLRSDRRHNFITALAFCAAIGAGISLLMESLQLLVPTRTPSPRDVVLNVISTGLGTIIGQAYRRTESSRALRPWLRTAAIDPVVAALLACWIAVHSIPFLPKLGLYRAWQAIATLRNLEWTSGGSAWWFACYIILASLLKTVVSPQRFWSAFGLFAAASLLAQIVFRQHQLEFDECIGLVLALPVVVWFQRLPARIGALPLWGFIIAGLLVTAFYPFDFSPTPRPLHWLPFSGALDAEMQNGMTSLLAKTFLYGGALWVGIRACGNVIVPTTLLVLVTAAIESLQTLLPTRTPESTDPLLMLLLAWLIAAARQRRPANESCSRDT